PFNARRCRPGLVSTLTPANPIQVFLPGLEPKNTSWPSQAPVKDFKRTGGRTRSRKGEPLTSRAGSQRTSGGFARDEGDFSSFCAAKAMLLASSAHMLTATIF